jgi:flagellar assembly protein FliH
LKQAVEVRQADAGIESFQYPGSEDGVAPRWELWDAIDIGVDGDRANKAGERCSEDRVLGESSSPGAEAIAAEVAEEAKRSFEAGREQGFREGRNAEREARSAETSPETYPEQPGSEMAARLAEDFQVERNRYFETVEQEVVKLALAIAARILRREAQADPLLLTGAVRVALGQLSGATQVRLRVPAADLELWRETIAHLPRLAVRPAVVAGDDLESGECRLENEMGSVDLGICAQLGEIERGYFDLAEHRSDGQAGRARVAGEEWAG